MELFHIVYVRISEWMLEPIVCDTDWFLFSQEHMVKTKMTLMADPGTRQHPFKWLTFFPFLNFGKTLYIKEYAKSPYDCTTPPVANPGSATAFLN